jgi:hypothetical protein
VAASAAALVSRMRCSVERERNGAASAFTRVCDAP